MFETRFTFLCSEEDKANLAKVADFHHRSQSDVIRLLLRMAITDILSSTDHLVAIGDRTFIDEYPGGKRLRRSG